MDLTQKGLQREATQVTKAMPMIPPVAIAENGEAITLWADLPGVAKENLSVGVEGDTLTIEGAVSLGESASLSDIYAEVGVAQYKRSFVLGQDLDKEKIDARLVNGVLTLVIPKVEQAKPRRIAVKAA